MYDTNLLAASSESSCDSCNPEQIEPLQRRDLSEDPGDQLQLRSNHPLFQPEENL